MIYNSGAYRYHCSLLISERIVGIIRLKVNLILHRNSIGDNCLFVPH